MKKHFWALCLLFATVWVVSAYAGAVRVLRVNMNDGSTKLFMVNYVSRITVTATDKDISSSSEEAVSSSSETVESSSSEEVVSSSSETVESSSSEEVVFSSSETVVSSSSETVESSSSEVVVSSSSETVESSSSEDEEHTTSIAATDLNSKVIWNARQQSLLLLAERSANAQVTIFDIHGVRLARLNFAVISGFNEVPLSKMNLANGRFVLHVDLDGKRSLKVISIGSVK